jgi:hypothetical protein
MRSAPAYPKQPSLRAFWHENGAWHTRPPADLYALRAVIPNEALHSFLLALNRRLAYAPASGFICAPRRHTQSSLHFVPSGTKTALGIRGWFLCLVCIFGFWAHPRCAGPGFPLQFASLRFANSASILRG